MATAKLALWDDTFPSSYVRQPPDKREYKLARECERQFNVPWVRCLDIMRFIEKAAEGYRYTTTAYHDTFAKEELTELREEVKYLQDEVKRLGGE